MNAPDLRWCLRLELGGGQVGFVAFTRPPQTDDVDAMTSLLVVARARTPSMGRPPVDTSPKLKPRAK